MTTKKLKDNGLLIIGWLILLSFVSGNIKATEVLFQFKNPAFSGIGTSAHYLTVDEQESSRKQKIAEDIESALDEAARELDNTTSGGSIDLEGNTINFLNTGTEIVLTILDIDGTITEIRIPIGSFGICADAPCVP